ncbi:hypothetical protein [Paenibacillus sp. 1A_MP2]|uniref:hypothetical protein n=1 Tax=Paenibacillus sp. 1A_MP2 TaxID=3457495 RepID=UPI003FCEAF9B
MGKSEKSIYCHPGTYNFKWPYVPGNAISDGQGEVSVYYCDVELRVGDEQDTCEGKLVTIVVTSYEPPGVQNWFEIIATKIRISFFDSIFLETHWGNPMVPEDKIRWIERHLFSGETGDSTLDSVMEVSMDWNPKKHIYMSAIRKNYKHEV